MSESTVLLLSDVVDSTQLAERLAMPELAALWEAHDRAARGLLRQWRGREIDKSDGFLLLFDQVADAVGFACAYHPILALLVPPLKARVGIHVGAVALRHNRADEVALGAKPIEVEGPAKPLAARVMSLALGGQILLSDSARAALGDTPLRVQSHGHWRLKGLQAPIELFEVGGPQAPFTPPPDAAKAYRVLHQGELWLPLRELRHTLPAERDSFVGREPALQELARRFDGGARLVSLLGIGGTGKTRLAQRFGWTWLGDFPGGVWFCDLSPATTVDGILHAVAQGLELPLGKADPVQQIGQAIAGRGTCLVIIDNFEQVARHAEATLGQWLDRAAEASFLVTSREVLGIVGEHAMVLPPLPVNDSVTLFMRRALAAAQSFAPVGDEAAAIEPLVKLLDGLPLAIELCAARARVMQPRMLLLRMSERFKLLARSGGQPDRRSTLRATLDWSWDLLTEPERSALAQLSVFEGGFTLEAAEAVIDLTAFDAAPWAVDVLQSLLQKSLVRQVSDRRFELLRSVQDYASHRLSNYAGLSRADAQTRHAGYFAARTEREAVADRCADTENLVAACRRAISVADAGIACRVLALSWQALKLTGPFQVAVALAAQMRSLPGLDVSDAALVDEVAGSALFLLGETDAARARLARGLASGISDAGLLARLQCVMGELLASLGEADAAQSALHQALEAARRQDDAPLLLCRVLNALGGLASDHGSFDEAQAHYEAALLLAQRAQDSRWRGGLLGNLGLLSYSRGQFEQARLHYEQALQLARDAGDRRWEGNTRCNLGLLHHEQGRSAEALVQFEAALAMARHLGHARLEATVLCNLGIVDEAAARFAEAEQRFAAAANVAAGAGDHRLEGQSLGYLAVVRARLGLFDPARSCLAQASRRLAVAPDKLSQSLLLCQSGLVEQMAGHDQLALQRLEECRAAWSGLQETLESELGRALRALAHALGQPVSV